MAASPPPAPADGTLPLVNSSPSPSHPPSSAAFPDPGGGEDGDEGTNMVAGLSGEVAEQLVGGRRDSPRSKNTRKRKHKGGLPVGTIPASPRVTTSPGVNMLVRAAALRRASMMVRSGSAKRAKMAGSPEGSTSHQSLDSPSQQHPISPSLDDLSPVGRMTSSHGWTRRPRKLVSRIWKEVEPIYRGKKLVKGRCVHCQKVFPASRDSGSSHIGRHLKLWNIKKTLNNEELSQKMKIRNKEASSQDIIIARMVQQMQIKFNQYWKESYKSACIPIIFDPRFKYDLLDYLLRDFGSEEEAGTWMDEVKKIMQKLFDEYNLEVSERESNSPNAEEMEDEDDPLAEWDQHMRSKRRQSSNEVDRYLKEELLSRKEEVYILQWWKINSSKYPVLSKMARDILAIPASTVPSESAFSTGGRVVSDYRSSLMCSTVEMLICLQDWFKQLTLWTMSSWFKAAGSMADVLKAVLHQGYPFFSIRSLKRALKRALHHHC